MNTWRKKPKRCALWTQTRNGLKPHGWRQTSPKPVKRLRSRSPASVAQRRIYLRQKRAFLKRHPYCAVFPNQPATQVHHKFGRIQRLLLWEPGWLPVSDKGHDWIHRNINLAREFGLIGPVGTWNNHQAAIKRIGKLAKANTDHRTVLRVRMNWTPSQVAEYAKRSQTAKADLLSESEPSQKDWATGKGRRLASDKSQEWELTNANL